MKVCWDTSPLVSALIRREGVPRRLLDLARAERMEVVMSADTLVELAEVLRRPRIASRYHITPTDADEFVQSLKEFGLVAPGSLCVEAVPDDPRDNHVLSAALETQCDYVVTGDQHLLSLGSIQGIPIVSPRDLLSLLQG